MHLKHLSLTNFRNYVRLELELPASTIVLHGDNAQGKTNLLEAIYYLAATRSPLARPDREVVNWLAEQDPLPHARLVGLVQRGDTLHRIEITLTKTDSANPNYRKILRLNGVNKRAVDIIGQVNVVLFRPEDIALVSGSPSIRRRYLDATLCQIDAHYCRTLGRYNRLLTQRNHLLRALRDRQGNRDQLLFWDEGLADSGARLIARRQAVLAALDELARIIHLELTGEREHLHLYYVPGLDQPHTTEPQYQLPPESSFSPDPTHIAEAFLARLRETRPREIAAGMTLIGPHRDDLRFMVGGVDMRAYGSRGQQRTIALALKLAEVQLMRQETGEHPLLLLDDVMSELDAAHRQCLTNLIDGSQQAMLTTTDLSDYSEDFLAGATVLRVEEGRIE